MRQTFSSRSGADESATGAIAISLGLTHLPLNPPTLGEHIAVLTLDEVQKAWLGTLEDEGGAECIAS